MAVKDFLVWLAGGGCIFAASWILERFPKYVALSSQVKEWIFFGVAAVLGATAYAVSVYVPIEVLVALAPFFGIIAAVFSYVFLGKTFHNTDKAAKLPDTTVINVTSTDSSAQQTVKEILTQIQPKG